MKRLDIFLAGIGIGLVAGALFMKRAAFEHYERISRMEIESVKKTFRERMGKAAPVEDHDAAPSPTVRPDDAGPIASVYPITYREYARHDGYLQCMCTYYEDGVVTDEMDRPIEQEDVFNGLKIGTLFHASDDEVVYVRSELRRCDYEIERSDQRWEDIERDGPDDDFPEED